MTQDNAQTVTKEAYKIGDILPDGWIVMGVSSDTAIPFSCEPDRSENLDKRDDFVFFVDAQQYANDLCDAGHENARIPSWGELVTIWREVVLGKRNNNSNFVASYRKGFGEYWSSTPLPISWKHRFVMDFYKCDREVRTALPPSEPAFDPLLCRDESTALVRVVRDEPHLKLV